MAVVDLKSAYRSVHIRPDEQCVTGLQWQFSGQKQPLTLCNTRLPFGARKSPAIFNRITQAVARSLRQAGHHCTVLWSGAPHVTRVLSRSQLKSTPGPFLNQSKANFN